MFSYSHNPFVRLVISLSLGIVFSTFVFHDTRLFFRLMVVFMAALLLLNKPKSTPYTIKVLSGILIWGLMFLLGATASSHYRQLDHKDHFTHSYQEATYFISAVIDLPIEKKKTHKTVVEVNAYQDSTGHWHSCSGKLLLYLEKDTALTKLQKGDLIVFSNSIQLVREPSNPGEFNYKRFLSFKYIHHQAYLKHNEYFIRQEHLFNFYNLASRLRQMMKKVLVSNGLKGDNLAVASALLLGQKSLLNPELQFSFASAGAMHVLAVSGLHVGIIYLILNNLLSIIGFKSDHSKKYNVVIIIIFLWLYAMVTGLSPSVVRAATMFTTITLGKLRKSRQSIYNTIASSAFILLLFKPNYLFEVGFQLSYLAVIGIVFLHPKIYGLIHINHKFMDKIWSLTAVSIAAQLATFPLALLYFHIFPSYFLFSNLIVIPAAAIIMYLGIFLFIISPIPMVANWVSYILIKIIDTLNIFVHWIEKLPNSVVNNIHISTSGAWALYIFIIFSIFFILKRRAVLLHISLMATLFFMIDKTHHFVSYQQYDYLCVYNINKQSAINFLSSDYNYMIDNGKFNIRLDENPFQMKNNWIQHGYGDCMMLDIHDLNRNPFTSLDSNTLGVAGKTITLITSSERKKYQHPIQIDYLILTYHPKINTTRILTNYQPKMIILDSSFSYYYAQKLKSKLPLTIPIHSTSMDGGIEIKLN